MPRISQVKKSDIKSLILAGKSDRFIAASKKVGKGTVQRIRATVSAKYPAPQIGRPSVLTETEQHECVHSYTRGGITTNTGISRHMKSVHDVTVSRFTVARVLRRVGIHAIAKKEKPLLNKKHIRDRLAWANAHKDWTVDDWKRVIWSDETRINRIQSDGQLYSLYRDGEPLAKHHVKEVIKHGGGRIMIWGCMTWEGVGYMCKIEGNLNQELYLNILQDELCQTIDFFSFEPSQIMFQQDNDPKHTAHSVRAWLDRQPFSHIKDWPANSPDLNPIEHLWHRLKVRLGGYDDAPSGMQALWERVQNEWENFTVEECRRLIESLPRRCQDVIKAKGKWTRY